MKIADARFTALRLRGIAAEGRCRGRVDAMMITSADALAIGTIRRCSFRIKVISSVGATFIGKCGMPPLLDLALSRSSRRNANAVPSELARARIGLSREFILEKKFDFIR